MPVLTAAAPRPPRCFHVWEPAGTRYGKTRYACACGARKEPHNACLGKGWLFEDEEHLGGDGPCGGCSNGYVFVPSPRSLS